MENLFNKLKEEGKIKEAISTLKTILYALVLATIIRTFLYEPFHIPSGSMKPTLLEGDYIFVSKFKYGFSRYSLPFGLPLIKNRIFDFHKPKRGDVIVFKLPRDTSIFYIKRLIGLPNDKVQIVNGDLYINDELITKNYVDEYLDKKYNRKLKMYTEKLDNTHEYKILHEKMFINETNNTREYIIPEGQYFFMGDNRDNSLDSRFKETGFVPYKNIVGKADVIFFSKDGSIFNIFNWSNIIRFDRIFTGIK